MNKNPTHIGDLLISFQVNKNSPPKRSVSPWEVKTKCGKALVWTTDPDKHWSGFPLTTYQDERWQIWALGEFYGDQPNFPPALHHPGDLNGHFIIFAYDGLQKRWHIFTNRFGTLHAYLAGEEKRAALSTFSPAVAEAASSKRLDWDALAGFFTFGFFLGHETYWQDIQILPPATHLTLDEWGKTMSQESTWHWYYDPKPESKKDQAITEFKDAFETVVQDQVRGKSVALPISGGLDSRSTLVPLSRSDFRGSADLFPFSYGYTKDSVETSIARQCAQKCGLDIQTWTIHPYLFDKLDRIMAAVEGFQDITLCRQAYVVNDLSVKSSHVLAAHWGDVWLDDMGLLGTDVSLSDDMLAQKLVKKFSKQGSQQLLDLFKDSMPVDNNARLESQIEDQLGELNAIRDLDFKVKAWKTQNWSFRWTLASMRMYQAGLFPLLPFYDHRLTDFFHTLPSAVVSNRNLQIDYIKQYAPELARVPWQPYDANLYNFQHFNSWLLPKRAIKKLGGILQRKNVIERNWEVQFLNPHGQKGLQKWLLTPGLKLHNFIEKAPLEAYLQHFYAQPDASNGYAVSMLLTFSSWLERYA